MLSERLQCWANNPAAKTAASHPGIRTVTQMYCLRLRKQVTDMSKVAHIGGPLITFQVLPVDEGLYSLLQV